MIAEVTYRVIITVPEDIFNIRSSQPENLPYEIRDYMKGICDALRDEYHVSCEVELSSVKIEKKKYPTVFMTLWFGKNCKFVTAVTILGYVKFGNVFGGAYRITFNLIRERWGIVRTISPVARSESEGRTLMMIITPEGIGCWEGPVVFRKSKVVVPAPVIIIHRKEEAELTSLKEIPCNEEAIDALTDEWEIWVNSIKE